MSKLDMVAPILWAKWGGLTLETLHQKARASADGLAFRALNSGTGVRQLLVVCTTATIPLQTADQTLHLPANVRPVDWSAYSAAELVFRTEKKEGLSHQELRDASGRAALVVCATRPTPVRALEAFFDLPV